MLKTCIKITLILFIAAFAIAPFALRAEKPVNPIAITKCPPVAAQMCTMEFAPVCAKLDDGEHKTYSNGCVACSHTSVISWVDGACEV